MKVEVDWDATSREPERAVCRAARNDYYDGDVMADGLEAAMSGVQARPRDVEWAFDYHGGADVTVDDVDEVNDPEMMKHARRRALLHKLLRSEHYGPFEHPQLAIHIEGVSRSLMAQITRHRHMSFDIQSMRYVKMEGDDLIKMPESIVKGEAVSREGVTEIDEGAWEEFAEAAVQCKAAYNNLVEMGVPKEDARFILPIGTKVNIYMSGNLRSFMHVLNMRGKADAQWEIRNLTEQVTSELDDWAPITAEYFEENGPFRLGL